MLVIKRDGTKEEFSFEKIHKVLNTVLKEEERAYDKLDRYLKANLDLNGEDDIEVDEIHSTVEQFLMKNNYFDAARAYIQFRYKKALDRAENQKFVRGVSKKLMAEEVANSNANLDENSFGGRLGEAMRFVAKDHALNYCMSKKSKMNHLNNEIYIHDLDSYSIGEHNCLTIPFDKLLAKGFNTRQVDIRPANSINTAFQLVAVIIQLQSLQQFGGVSASHLDWTMVPYVRKSFYKHYKTGLKYLNKFDDKQIEAFGINDQMTIEDDKYKEDSNVYNYALDLTNKELEQAVEGMYHNLNSLQSRSGKSDCPINCK